MAINKNKLTNTINVFTMNKVFDSDIAIKKQTNFIYLICIMNIAFDSDVAINTKKQANK